MTEPSSKTRIEIRYVPAERIAEVVIKLIAGDPGAYLPVEELEPVDQPVLVHRQREANHPRNLRTIFKRYQRLDGEDRIKVLDLRPMGIGDCLMIFGVPYYVTAAMPNPAFAVVIDGNITPVVEAADDA